MMFRNRVRVECIGNNGQPMACPVAQIDNFCMRNFTNDAIFDDTLPVGDGLLEIGDLVPLDRLRESMEAWFRRKCYLAPDEALRLTPLA